jgi:RNA recognition motif-containing protein
MHSSSSRTAKKKICLIVDGAYVYKLCGQMGKRLMFKKLRERIREHCDGLPFYASVFVDFIPDQTKPFYKSLRDADFETVSCMMKTETRFDHVRKQFFQARVQKGGDILIAYYLMRWAEDPAVEHVVMLAGDGDFYPILRFYKELVRDKSLLLLHFRESISDTLLPYCEHIAIDTDVDWNDAVFERPASSSSLISPLCTSVAVSGGQHADEEILRKLAEIPADELPSCIPSAFASPFSSSSSGLVDGDGNDDDDDDGGQKTSLQSERSREREAVRDRRVIYVGNFAPGTCLQQNVVKLFQPFGFITSIRILNVQKRTYKFAKVTFETTEMAASAIAKMNAYVFYGRPLKVCWNELNDKADSSSSVSVSAQEIGSSSSSSSSSASSSTAVPEATEAKMGIEELPLKKDIYVGNLRVEGLTADEISRRFGIFGPLDSVAIFHPKKLSKAAGARIVFQHAKDAANAISAMQGATCLAIRSKCVGMEMNILETWIFPMTTPGVLPLTTNTKVDIDQCGSDRTRHAKMLALQFGKDPKIVDHVMRAVECDLEVLLAHFLPSS